jgi:hypothetical protein
MMIRFATKLIDPLKIFSAPETTSKKIWNYIKGIVRAIARIMIEILFRLAVNLFDTLFGFLNWPRKRLRIKILILKDSNDCPVVLPADLVIAIAFAKESLMKNFKVTLLPLEHEQFVDVADSIAPHETLYTKGGPGALGEEFKTTGSFFATNLRRSFFPVTAFVVIDIAGAIGCSLGPLTDYVTLDINGAKKDSTLVHEIAHACGLWHVKARSNLLYRNTSRGNEVNWWQKCIFRSSRHITYW